MKIKIDYEFNGWVLFGVLSSLCVLIVIGYCLWVHYIGGIIFGFILFFPLFFIIYNEKTKNVK